MNSPKLNRKPSSSLKQNNGYGPVSGGANTDEAFAAAKADLVRKSPPQSIEAEQAVLGGIFLKNSILHSLADTLSEDDFYVPAHRIIYAAIIELYRVNSPVDLVTVAEYLKGHEMLDAVGGAVYIGELAQSVISASNAEHYAKIVTDQSLKRQLIEAAATIIELGFDGAKSVDNIMDEAEQAIFKVTEKSSGTVFKGAKELVDAVFNELQERVQNNDLVTGVPTGYHKLDEITAGLQGSDLIIVAARPSMGKTAFVLNVGMRAAVMHQVPVAIFSLEMSMESLMMRMLCAWGKVDLANLRRGFIPDDDWARLYDAANALSQSPLYIDDTAAITTMELRARCRRLKAEKGIGMVIVDYLQLMRSSARTDSREQEISDISRSLKGLAKELKIPVIALSQLNRKVEERTNKRPMMSDLRESGAIEQDADIITFLYRDDAYNKREDNPRKGIAEIIIAKQRNGPTGTVELAYLNRYTAFEDLDETYVPPPPEPAE